MSSDSISLNLAPAVAAPRDVCDITREEFRIDKKRLEFICPVCELAVARHRAAAPAAQVAQPAQARSKWDYPKIHGLVKDIRWLKNSDSQTSRQFFSKIEVRLTEYDDLKDTDWLKLLPSLMDDAEASYWVKDEIAFAVPPLTWAQGIEKFSQHFDSSDLVHQNRTRFAKCRMTAGEPVQEFTTRFINLCTRLGYHKGEHETRSIEEMIDRLTPELRRNYQLMKSTIMRTGNAFEIAKLQSLHDVSESLIELGHTLSSNSSSSHGQSSDRKESGGGSLKVVGKNFKRSASAISSSGTEGELRCSYHVNARSHTDADCSYLKNKRARVQSGSNSRPPNKGPVTRSSSEAKSKVVCYNCNEEGHIKPNCPLLANGNSKSASSGSKAPGRPAYSPGNAKPSGSKLKS